MRMYAVTTGTDLLASCRPRRPVETGAEGMVACGGWSGDHLARTCRGPPTPRPDGRVGCRVAARSCCPPPRLFGSSVALPPTPRRPLNKGQSGASPSVKPQVSELGTESQTDYSVAS